MVRLVDLGEDRDGDEEMEEEEEIKDQTGLAHLFCLANTWLFPRLDTARSLSPAASPQLWTFQLPEW